MPASLTTARFSSWLPETKASSSAWGVHSSKRFIFSIATIPLDGPDRQNVSRVTDAELNMGPLDYAAPIPEPDKALVDPHGHEDGAAALEGEAGLIHLPVEVVEDCAVAVLVRIRVVRQRLPSGLEHRCEFLLGRPKQDRITGVQQVQATPQSNHRAYHCGLCTTLADSTGTM